MKGFKAYDIRGIYNQDFNREDVYRMGHFLPKLLNTNRILVGHDHRTSSEEIREALVRGITSAGADVYDMGLATTPMVYFTSGRMGFEASVQITASHNPREYNGFKISGKDVVPVGYTNGLDRLEQMVQEAPLKEHDTPGKVVPLDNKTEYLAFLRNNYSPGKVEKLNLAIDCSNGITGKIYRQQTSFRGNQVFEFIQVILISLCIKIKPFYGHACILCHLIPRHHIGIMVHPCQNNFLSRFKPVCHGSGYHIRKSGHIGTENNFSGRNGI